MKGTEQQVADLDQLTILSRQTSIRGGVFEVAHDITIRGTLEGEVKVGGRIDVLQGAEVEGSVRAKEAVIAGTVRGDVTVEGMLILRATSVVAGRVEARAIAVEEGASGVVTVTAGPEASGVSVQERRGGARRELGEALARARAAVAAAKGVPVVQADPAPKKSWAAEIAIGPSNDPARSPREISTDEMLASSEIRRFLSGGAKPAEPARTNDDLQRRSEETES